jgi:hypothetical protein
MATLQIQDVFEPYYAGREATRSGPYTDAERQSLPDATDRGQLDDGRSRLDVAGKRFARAMARLPKRDR